MRRYKIALFLMTALPIAALLGGKRRV